MPNVLPTDKQIAVIGALAEGSSIPMDHLANLQEKAKRISRYSLAVSKWVEDRMHGYNSTAGENKVYMSEGGGRVDVLSDPSVAKAVDFEAAKSLALEMKEARRRVEELSERKKSLGLK